MRVAVGDEPDVPLGVREALCRTTQEALHNTVKHARAENAKLDAEGILLEVCDKGMGFDPSGSFPVHLGLTADFSAVDPYGMLRTDGSAEKVYSTGATCMAWVGQYQRNPL